LTKNTHVLFESFAELNLNNFWLFHTRISISYPSNIQILFEGFEVNYSCFQLNNLAMEYIEIIQEHLHNLWLFLNKNIQHLIKKYL